jgi:hypothetical protein
MLFRQRQTDLYLRTPMQLAFVALLVLAMAWPIVGGVALLSRGFRTRRLVQLLVTAALLLAFVVPHPKVVCSHCHQGACGACPVGRRVWEREKR